MSFKHMQKSFAHKSDVQTMKRTALQKCVELFEIFITLMQVRMCARVCGPATVRTTDQGRPLAVLIEDASQCCGETPQACESVVIVTHYHHAGAYISTELIRRFYSKSCTRCIKERPFVSRDARAHAVHLHVKVVFRRSTLRRPPLT